jgi:hypothetical protein
MGIAAARFRMGAEGASPEAQETVLEAQVVPEPAYEDPFKDA